LQQTAVPLHLINFRPFSWRCISLCWTRQDADRRAQPSQWRALRRQRHSPPSCSRSQPLASHTRGAQWVQYEGLWPPVMMSSTASALSNSVTRPSTLAAVPFALGMPRTPERAYLVLAWAMVIKALGTVLASPVSHWNPVGVSYASSNTSQAFKRNPYCILSRVWKHALSLLVLRHY